MCDCWEGQPEMFSRSTPVARKEYRCCECNNVIPKGQKHVCDSGKWDGEFNTFRICMDCMELASNALLAMECKCIAYGNLGQELIWLRQDDTIPPGADAFWERQTRWKMETV